MVNSAEERQIEETLEKKQGRFPLDAMLQTEILWDIKEKVK
jgi:hypothetical protein